MKHTALLTIINLFVGFSIQAVQFNNLTVGATYRVWQDGTVMGEMIASEGMLQFENNTVVDHLFLELVGEGQNEATETATPSPTPEDDVEPTPQPTSTPEPTEDLSNDSDQKPEEETLMSTQVLFVAGFDSMSTRNQYEVLNTQGTSLSGTVPVLEGINTVGQFERLTVDENGLENLVVAGMDQTGVRIEIWNGRGTRLASVVTLDANHNLENNLFTANLDGNGSQEIALLARTPEGSYVCQVFDSELVLQNQFECLQEGYAAIDDCGVADVNNSGSDNIVLLARTAGDVVTMQVLGNTGIIRSKSLYNSSYVAPAAMRIADFTGNGVADIATVAYHNTNRQHQIQVVDGNGIEIAQQTALNGSFDSVPQVTVANLDQDAAMEIALMGYETSRRERVMATIDPLDNMVRHQVVFSANYGSDVQLVAADTDGDMQDDLVISAVNSRSGKMEYEVYQSDGMLLTKGTAYGSQTNFVPGLSVTDLDQDGSDEVVFAGMDSDGGCALKVTDLLNSSDLVATYFSWTPDMMASANLAF